MNDKEWVLRTLKVNKRINFNQLLIKSGIEKRKLKRLIGELIEGLVIATDERNFFYLSTQKPDAKFNSLAEKAKALEEKGFFRRADKIWLEAMDSTKSMTLREKAMKKRMKLLKKSRANSYPKNWNFPGGINHCIEVMNDRKIKY